MKTSEQLNEVAAALCKMQGQLATVKKDTKGYNYKYATLASVWDIIRLPLLENGLSIAQDTRTSDGCVSVSTRVMHTSGQWIEFGPLVVPMAKKDAHATGSATTYGRRYSLCAAIGVVSDEEDDDGAAANRSSPNADDIVKKFLDKWSGKYGKEALVSFVKDKATFLGIKERAVINMYLRNDEGFKREIEAYLAKKTGGMDDETV